MSGTTCEAALLTLVRAYTGATFDAANSSVGDFRVMDAKGSRASVVILRRSPSDYGANLSGRGSHGAREEEHHLAVIVAYKRLQATEGDGGIYTDLTTLTDGLAAYLARYGRLGLGSSSSVQRAHIVRVSDPRLNRRGTADASTHLLQTIDLDVLTRETVSYASGEVPG